MSSTVKCVLWGRVKDNVQKYPQVQQQLENMGADPVYVTEMRAEMRGCMWHPVADEHTAIAESLAGFISTNQLLGK